MNPKQPLNPFESELPIRMKLNHTLTYFWIRINLFYSIRMNPRLFRTNFWILLNPFILSQSKPIQSEISPESPFKSEFLLEIQSEVKLKNVLNRIFSRSSIRINPNSDWSKPNFQWELIRTNPRSEWFELISIENWVSDLFGFIRIVSSD